MKYDPSIPMFILTIVGWGAAVIFGLFIVFLPAIIAMKDNGDIDGKKCAIGYGILAFILLILSGFAKTWVSW